MNEFSIRRLDVRDLHISLVHNPAMGERSAHRAKVSHWHVDGFRAVTIHIGNWFLNLDLFS